MSNFKVSKEKISLFTHPNADALMIGRVGSYQVVVQKDLYKDGDEIVFAPEKSVLTGQLKAEYEKYLSGPNKDRVKAVRLRNEISSGIIIPKNLVPKFPKPENLKSLGVKIFSIFERLEFTFLPTGDWICIRPIESTDQYREFLGWLEMLVERDKLQWWL